MSENVLPGGPAPTGLMARKSVGDIIKGAESEGNLPRTLGAFSITAMGIGCIIGAGIFVLTGTAAAQYAGPGIMLSFVLGGIAIMLRYLVFSDSNWPMLIGLACLLGGLFTATKWR